MNNEDILKENGGKKFDIVLMNPPYNRNLHIKFLDKVCKLSENVVSIQPVDWLMNPEDNTRSLMHRYKHIIERIKDMDVLDINYSAKMFNAAFNSQIGIYVLSKNGGFDISKLLWNRYNKDEYYKYSKFFDTFPPLKEYDENTSKAFVTIKTFANNARTTRYNIVAPNTYNVIYKKHTLNGDYWEDKRYKSKSLSKSKPLGIYFDKLENAKNFYNSCLTEAYKYIVSIYKKSGSVPIKKLPFFNDYSKPLNNDKIFDLLDIQTTRRKEIIEQMKQFM